MLQNINATRMELLRLRRRLGLAVRGHHLLSEKRDEISRQLIKITNQLKMMRRRLQSHLEQIFQRFIFAGASMETLDLKAALEVPSKKLSLLVRFSTVMNVKIPQLVQESRGDIFCYGFVSTSGELDQALLELDKLMDELIKLASMEKQAHLLANELIMTRRRVNVLEHIVIPEIGQTIRFIYSKLAEAERDNITRLLKIADIIRK